MPIILFEISAAGQKILIGRPVQKAAFRHVLPHGWQRCSPGPGTEPEREVQRANWRSSDQIKTRYWWSQYCHKFSFIELLDA
jgi:hypothetical protein